MLAHEYTIFTNIHGGCTKWGLNPRAAKHQVLSLAP